jgi:hypothetical protein
MSTLCCDPPAKTDLWEAYRSTFAEFSQKLRRLQALSSQPDPDPESLLEASFEVGQARTRYSQQRDALAQMFLR